MAKLFIILGSFGGMLAVVLGAFGAHGLRERLDESSMAVYQTAVQYHMYHSLALLGVGLFALQFSQSTLLKTSGWMFVLGIIIFSGSLYVLSMSGIRWLGAITPLGGLAFITGWACLAMASWKLLG